MNTRSDAFRDTLQGVKPIELRRLFGTTEVVPFPNNATLGWGNQFSSAAREIPRFA